MGRGEGGERERKSEERVGEEREQPLVSDTVYEFNIFVSSALVSVID